jgi:immune inhibitor A
VDALTLFCQTDNLQRFDNDGDGYVDGIFLIHAGGGAEAESDPTKRPHKIWSHKWILPQPFVNQGVKVYAYSTEPEDGRVGVFAHEFGHVLGLPDLYDSTYRSKGIGNWCLMAGGSWGGGGNKPVRMSCWCLSKLGWLTPKVVKKAATLTLQPLAVDPNACYRPWSKGKVGSEYFLLENRQKTGRDGALPGSGLAVWHIDETQSSNTNPLSYLVALVQADGKRDLEFNRGSGDTGDLFPGAGGVTKLSDTTTPSTHSNMGTPTGVALSQITESNGVVKLKVKV